MGQVAQEKPALTTRRYRLLAIVIGGLIGSCALWGANKQILGLFHDDGIYAVVAKSLARGSGYRIISLPGEPLQTKYPFLYSYLLSWIWSFDGNFPHNIVLLKSFNIALLIALFFAAIFFYRRVSSDMSGWGLVFGVLLCTNPIIFTLTDYVLSDLLLVLFAVIALSLCSAELEVSGFRQEVRLALVTGFACLTRSAAVPLVIAGAMQSIVFRRFRDAAFYLFTVLAIVLPWLLWVAFSPRPELGSLFDYYSAYNFTGAQAGASGWSFAHTWTVIAGNMRHLLTAFNLSFLLPLFPGFAAAVILFSSVGMIFCIRKQLVAFWSFFLSGLALILVWPFHPSRYLAPFIPVLLVFFFCGVRIFQSWVFHRSRANWRLGFSWIAASPILILLLLNGIWLSSYLLIRDDKTTRSAYGSRLPYGWKGFEESFAWIRQNTQSESVLGTAYDPLYFLYTGRQAIRPALHRPASYFYPYGATDPDVGSVAEIKPQMEKLRIRYLIIDPMDGYAEGNATLKLFGQIVQSYAAGATLVFRSTDGKHRIYALKPE